jgi:SAM-dependent methyltransferase
LVASRKGFEVVALDLQEQRPPWHDPAVRLVKGDVLESVLDESTFDLVINCSSIEHVGLAGRYGVREYDEAADLEAMERLRQALRPGGLMLLTLPVGRDAVVLPLHRIYGERRLPLLLKRFEILYDEYWIKKKGRWVQAPRSSAIAFDAGPRRAELYALGCFVLRHPQEASNEGQR